MFCSEILDSYRGDFMSTPQILFVHRLGKFRNEFRARCVCCDSQSSRRWNPGKTWHGFILESGIPVEFRQAVSDGTGDERGPADVYADEACLHGLESRDSLAIMAAQNYAYLVFNSAARDTELPFVVSTVDPSTPCNRRVELHFETTDIRSLPDVRDYEETLGSGALDRWDKMLLSDSTVDSLRFPVGLWLPVSISDGRRDAAGVYSIVEWLNEETAIVDIVSSDKSVVIDLGSKLSRRFQMSSGLDDEECIGSVTKMVDYAFANR